MLTKYAAVLVDNTGAQIPARMCGMICFIMISMTPLGSKATFRLVFGLVLVNIAI